MQFITSIFLACTSIAYTSKLDPYSIEDNNRYYPQNYEHIQGQPHTEKVLYYPNLFGRVDKNLQPENDVIEKFNVPDKNLRNGFDIEYYSAEPETTSPSSPLLLVKESHPVSISDDDDVENETNNAFPSKINQEPPNQPKYNDYNGFSSKFTSLPSKIYKERPKNPYKIKYSSNLSLNSNKYQSQSKYADNNEYLSYDSQKKMYQNRAEEHASNCNATFVSPSEDIYSLQITCQTPSKYGGAHKPVNNGYASNQIKQNGPNFLKNQYYEDASSMSASYSESWSSEEEPKTKHPINKSPQTYEDSDFSDYEDQQAPPTPQYLAPQYVDNHSSELPAPPFINSLQDFEDAEEFIQSRIFGNNPNQNGKQFAILTGVLDGMIKTMSHTPWKYYDQEYKYMVPKLFKYAQIAKEYAKTQMKCASQWVDRSIKKIRAIIDNEWINYICQMSKVPCDTLVLAVIDASYDTELKQEARLLLALGKTANLYLNKYAKILDRVASTNRASSLYDFILKSQQFFKPLIKASSEAHNLLPNKNYKCYSSKQGKDNY